MKKEFKQIIPKTKVPYTLKERKILHRIENGTEQFIEIINGEESVNITNPINDYSMKLEEVLYYDKESNLLMKKETDTEITYYKYNESGSMIGYHSIDKTIK